LTPAHTQASQYSVYKTIEPDLFNLIQAAINEQVSIRDN
jgi:hypothetical protein